MKKLIAKFFIALVVFSGVPSISFANSNSLTESFNPSANYNQYRVSANTIQTHRIFLNRGTARIVISGDGDTDLDLYFYDDDGLVARSESYGDDEAVSVNIYSSGYFTVKVYNRGNVYNDYAFAIQ